MLTPTMLTSTSHGDTSGHTPSGHHRRMVRTELDLLGLGITSLLADEPCHYSPLVLVGSPVATSAVLQDIHHHWQRLHNERVAKGVRSLFIDPQRLARDLESAAGDGLDSVHRRWVSAALVLIDGIEQLSSQGQLTALPHLLDRVSESGSRLICSLSQEPGSRGDLTAAITSRLGEGLVVTVRDATGLPAPAEPAAGTPQPTLRRILSATARHYGLMPVDLVGSSRRRTIALARGIAMHLARQLCGESLAGIGRRFNGRDHTTVLHAIRVTQERIERDQVIADDFEAILRALGNRAARHPS